MSMRMGYECECESENVHEFEPNTRTAPCRGCQVHSFVSRSSLPTSKTQPCYNKLLRMVVPLRNNTQSIFSRRGGGGGAPGGGSPGGDLIMSPPSAWGA